jgi:tetratricopeptide (TPR) repeat protein
MQTAGKLTIALAAAAVVFAIALSSSCGPSPSSVQDVRITVAPEEQKTIYVDNFINLTGNSELNLLEESIPEMLLTSMDGLRAIKIIPRDKLQKYIAVKSEQDNSLSIFEAAKSLGADYLIDGWIETTHDDKFRVYSNLLNLSTNKLRERFAVVEFSGKEEALQAVGNLITDIQDTLSLTREELDKAESRLAADYDVQRQFTKAWQTYQRGKPEVSAALFEKTIQMAMQRKQSNLESGQTDQAHDPVLYYRFVVGQIYNELDDEQRAIAHLQPVYDNREEFTSNADTRKFIEGLWAELHGDYSQARKIYTEIKDFERFQSEYYLRMSRLLLKEGRQPERALAIINRGVKRFPDDFQLLNRQAELEYMVEGEEAVERYTNRAAEQKDDPVTTEVASRLVTEKLLDDSIKELSRTLPAVTIEVLPMPSAEPKPTTGSLVSFNVGGVKLNLKIDKFMDECDTTCEITLDHAALLATLAAEKGKTDIALEIAGLISAKVTAQKGSDLENRIRAVVALNQGDFVEAEKLARKISESDPNRFLTLGNIYLHLGRAEEAAAVMERALNVGKEVSPIVYYQIANANLLAGNYKKWDYFTKIFLERTTERNKAVRKASEQQ